jgi:hypothetical protein
VIHLNLTISTKYDIGDKVKLKDDGEVFKVEAITVRTTKQNEVEGVFYDIMNKNSYVTPLIEEKRLKEA